MNAVVNPDLFLLEQDQLNDEIKRDSCLETVIDLFRCIEESKETGIYWDVDYEFLIWDDAKSITKISDPNFRRRFNQKLYKLLVNNKIEVEDSIIYDPCEIQNAESPCEETMRMMHYCLDRNERVYYLTNKPLSTNVYFYCEHENKMYPRIVLNENEFITKQELIDMYWPTNDSNASSDLCYIINHFNKRDYGDSHFLYSFTFKTSFVKSLIEYKEYGERIIDQIVKRLHMSLSEAQANKSIHDEYIQQNKERRFRVTGRPTSTRIHYLLNKKTIEFLRFYGPGEHDKGL